MIKRAYQLRKVLAEAYISDLPAGESTGWHNLDRFLTVAKGQLDIVTGVPSHGKSEFIDALCVNLSVKHGWKHLMFSPENYPIENHIIKLMRKVAGKPYSKQYTNHMTVEEVAKAMEIIDDCFRFIDPGSDGYTIDNILEDARFCIQESDIDSLVIDPWNEIEHKRPSGLSETEYISDVLSKLRRFARSNDIKIWLIAHPKKPDPGRSYKTSPPNLYDVSGSAHWYNKADNGITVHRPDVIDGSEANIYITKVRFRHIGKPTDEPVILKYSVASGRYYE